VPVVDEPHVLAVTREEGLLRLLRLELECAGVGLTSARSLTAARERLGERQFDAVMIDAQVLTRDAGSQSGASRNALPGAETIPTVMLVGDGWERSARWHGTVDDFVALPADAAQVAGRVLALINHSAVEPSVPAIVHHGDTVIDFRHRRIERSGQYVRLTPPEWSLLRALACASDTPLTSADILERAWGPAYRDDEAMLIAWIRQLRRRLADDLAAPTLVLGNIVDGYRLVQSDDRDDGGDTVKRQSTANAAKP
jgi:two-component system, OmpR family, KDP operon response regulator KdpE